MISKKFGQIATAGALALSVAFATPAMAGKDFFKKDCSAETTLTCQLAGEELSEDKLTFVVHGGNRKLQMAAYRVAQRLDDENIPVAFLLAPDEDNIENTMSVAFYAKGGTQYSVTAFDNDKITIERTEADLYGQAMNAVRDDFPQYLKRPGQTADKKETTE